MSGFRVIAGGRSDGDSAAPARPGSASRDENHARLREFYQQHGGSVYGRCYYILKDKSKAEDAMQDVFAKAMDNFSGYRGEASPLTWLLKITTHHCLNVVRGERAAWRARFERDEVDRIESGLESGGPRVFEARDFLTKVLSRFDAETQAAAIHYHLDEMTLDEVAALLERSVPTVRKRLEEVARACKKELS